MSVRFFPLCFGAPEGRPSGTMSQKLLAGGLSLARGSSVLVFFGRGSQACLLSLPPKPNRRRTPFSHVTAQALPALLSAFAPVPLGAFPRPGLSLEPRYYHNLQKRYLAGKKTANNSANYFSVLTKAYTSVGALNLSLIPTYGIRRGGDHWFQEYSFGVALHTRSVAALLPHLGFRFGYTF